MICFKKEEKKWELKIDIYLQAKTLPKNTIFHI